MGWKKLGNRNDFYLLISQWNWKLLDSYEERGSHTFKFTLTFVYTVELESLVKGKPFVNVQNKRLENQFFSRFLMLKDRLSSNMSNFGQVGPSVLSKKSNFGGVWTVFQIDGILSVCGTYYERYVPHLSSKRERVFICYRHRMKGWQEERK